MTVAWHIPIAHVDSYLAGDADPVAAASMESHLLSCGQCRRTLAGRSASTAHPDAVDLGSSWAALEARIDREPTWGGHLATPRLGGRWLAWLGWAAAVARPMGSAWGPGSIASFVVAAAIARVDVSGGHLGRLIFLTLAPLIPLSAVAAAMSASSEPMPEVSLAAPASRLRIAALRASLVLACTVAVGMAVSAIAPGPWLAAVGWLCPALALSSIGAVLARRFRPVEVVTVVGSGWIGVVAVAYALTVDRLAAFHTGPQLVYLAVAVIVASLLAVHPPRSDLRSIE